MCIGAALAATGTASTTHAQASDWEYLDLSIELTEQERRPHDVGSELIVLTLEVTNNGDRIVHKDGVFIYIQILDGADHLTYGNTYWSSGPMSESCQKDIRNINARLTKTWNVCFEIPEGWQPDFLGVSYSDTKLAHIVPI